MGRRKRNIVVIGLDTFGHTIATELSEFGNYVLGIDSDEERVNDIVDKLDEAVILDCRDEEALREAGVGDYDVAVVALGHDIEASVLATMNVKLLGVDTIWVKAVTRTHHRILNKLGADRVVQPEQDAGRHVAQMLHNPLLRDYLSLGNGYYIVDLRVPENLHGQPVRKLGLRDHPDLRCMGIMRGTDYLEPNDESTALEADDKLLVLGKRDELRDFSDKL